jgi:hypothetical protein
MFVINATLLFLSIVYSLLNLKVENIAKVDSDDVKFEFFLFLVANNAETETFNGDSIHSMASRFLRQKTFCSVDENFNETTQRQFPLLYYHHDDLNGTLRVSTR